MKRGITPTEHQMQCAVIEWWASACKHYDLPVFALFSVPNGAILAGNPAARARQMNSLKRSGLRPGIPDLILAYRNRRFSGLFIEMKRRPNKPTKEQLSVLQYLKDFGYCSVVCYSTEEAIRTIEDYLLP